MGHLISKSLVDKGGTGNQIVLWVFAGLASCVGLYSGKSLPSVEMVPASLCVCVEERGHGGRWF